MATKPKTTKRGILAMFGAFFIVAMSMLTAPFVEQKKKSNDVPVQKVVARRTMPYQALAIFGIVAVASVLIAAPVAAEINLSVITEVINAFIDIIDPIVNLVVAIVPLWFIMQILGFIMGLLAAILAMIRFQH
jgi:hypothetical protein